MQKKNVLFGDDEPQQASSLEKLNINEDFKRKFEYFMLNSNFIAEVCELN
jgi:hypothetical protein